VSMYLLMCDSCKVKLTLLDASNGEVIEQDFSQLVSSEWREIKFVRQSKRYQNNTFKLLVSTFGGTSDQRFWAIDRVRLCQKEEFRMIVIQNNNTPKATCQLMSNDNKIITFRDSLQVSESECLENTVGEFCVPCKWIYKNCEQIKICVNDKCVCSSGYNIPNHDCTFGCEDRRYGHGCKKNCGKCNNSYSDYNNCTDGFSGPRCDILPNAVTELMVYTKNESSASLRWKPPFPPTGVLQKYKIVYEKKSSYELGYINEFEITSCKLWPNFHCATVYNLERGVEYKFEVNAKNEDVAEFGPAISIDTKTEIEPSRKPYDLNITWTINNDLILQWKHPNESNGPIQYFNIILNSETNKVEKSLLIMNDTYYLNYNFKIDSAEAFPSTRYIVQVSAFNGLPGYYVYLKDTSPPDIPLLNGDPESDNTNDTITLKISLQKPRGQIDKRLLYILIFDKNNNLDSHKFERFGVKNFKIVANCTLEPSQDSLNVTIGNAYQFDNCYQTNNLPQEPATFYNITILLLHTFQNKSSHKIYSLMYKTGTSLPDMYKTLDGPVYSKKNLFGLLVLLFLIPMIIYLYVKINKILKPRQNLSRRNNTSPIPLDKVENATSNTGPKNQNGETSTTGDIYSKKVEAEHFLNYVKTCMQTKELEREHQMILNSLAMYETLHRGPLEYVDVQFANGRLVEKAYVTSTIPESNEIDSFWKTIWDENIYNIVLFDTCHINDLVRVIHLSHYTPTLFLVENI
jgi:hypothetical protein